MKDFNLFIIQPYPFVWIVKNIQMLKTQGLLERKKQN